MLGKIYALLITTLNYQPGDRKIRDASTENAGLELFYPNLKPERTLQNE
jgi:hypothetical protein